MTNQRRSASKRSSKAKAATTTELQPVVICTEHKGVFFGHIDPSDATKTSIKVQRARNCIYWAQTIGGVLGLARTGPNRDCRIGAEAPAVVLHGVTAVMEVTEPAAKAWTEAPCVS